MVGYLLELLCDGSPFGARQVPTAGRSSTINNLVFRATLHRRRLRHHSPTLPSPVFVAMATIARELHDGLVTVLDKLNMVVAVL
jgi:hypothetical protein